jgi:hypothetical protein
MTDGEREVLRARRERIGQGAPTRAPRSSLSIGAGSGLILAFRGLNVRALRFVTHPG